MYLYNNDLVIPVMAGVFYLGDYDNLHYADNYRYNQSHYHICVIEPFP